MRPQQQASNARAAAFFQHVEPEAKSRKQLRLEALQRQRETLAEFVRLKTAEIDAAIAALESQQ